MKFFNDFLNENIDNIKHFQYDIDLLDIDDFKETLSELSLNKDINYKINIINGVKNSTILIKFKGKINDINFIIDAIKNKY
jgi:hypothetical protein